MWSHFPLLQIMGIQEQRSIGGVMFQMAKSSESNANVSEELYHFAAQARQVGDRIS